MSRNRKNNSLEIATLSAEQIAHIWGGVDFMGQKETLWSRDTFGVGNASVNVAGGTFKSSGGTTGSWTVKAGSAQSSGQHDPKTGATSSGPAVGIDVKF